MHTRPHSLSRLLAHPPHKFKISGLKGKEVTIGIQFKFSYNAVGFLLSQASWQTHNVGQTEQLQLNINPEHLDTNSWGHSSGTFITKSHKITLTHSHRTAKILLAQMPRRFRRYVRLLQTSYSDCTIWLWIGPMYPHSTPLPPPPQQLSASGSQGGLKSREVLPEKYHMDLRTLNFNSLSFVGFSGEGENLRGGSCLVFHFILYNYSFLCFLILFFFLSFLSFLSYFPICFFLLPFFLFPFIPASSSSCSLKAFFGKRCGDAQNDIQKAAEQEWCFKQLMI